MLQVAALAAAGGRPVAGPGGVAADVPAAVSMVDLSDLRRRYSARLQHSLLIALLASLLTLGLAFLVLVLLLYPHVSVRHHFRACVFFFGCFQDEIG